ncbi:MAG: ComEC/Rec2 family competence protein [Planctomycetota bacterium]|jgi:predicted membrane metal-binding protein
MNKRPLAVIAVFFIFGIVLARFLPDSVGFFHIFIVTLVFILASFIFSRYQKISSTLLLFSITSFAALLYVNSNIFPANHISHYLGEEKLKTSIIGVIKSPALKRGPYYGKINSIYLFEIEGIKDNDEWPGVKGLAQIRIQTEKNYGYGNRLLVTGTVRKPPLPLFVRGRTSNKGFNYREYLERQNIFALINTKENNIAILSHNYKSNPILRYIYLIRERLKNRFIEKMPLESGAFLSAILLGDRSELPKHIQTSFKNSGVYHISPIQNTKKLSYSS